MLSVMLLIFPIQKRGVVMGLRGLIIKLAPALGPTLYPMFTLGTMTMFLGILIILSTGILLPMYLQGALLFSAAMAGLILLPGNAVNFILSPIVGALFDKVGARRFTAVKSSEPVRS